jgi:hypothetical protein
MILGASGLPDPTPAPPPPPKRLTSLVPHPNPPKQFGGATWNVSISVGAASAASSAAGAAPPAPSRITKRYGVATTSPLVAVNVVKGAAAASRFVSGTVRLYNPNTGAAAVSVVLKTMSICLSCMYVEKRLEVFTPTTQFTAFDRADLRQQAKPCP